VPQYFNLALVLESKMEEGVIFAKWKQKSSWGSYFLINTYRKRARMLQTNYQNAHVQ
jgi:hypothetical protein